MSDRAEGLVLIFHSPDFFFLLPKLFPRKYQQRDLIIKVKLKKKSI